MFARKNIKRFYLIGLRKIRSFLLSAKSRELLIFLFFVIVSFCFWLLQTMNDTYQTEFKIPVRLKNVPKEVVMTSEIPNEIRVSVEDRGTVLLNYMLGRTFFPISFDFQDYQDKGAKVTIPLVEFNKKITSQLASSTKLLSVRPNVIEFIYTRGNAKKVPVAAKGRMVAGRQYYISNVLLAPDSVVVYAPKDVLNSITTAYTEPLDLENITDTVVQRIHLQEVKGAKFAPAFTDVTICVDMYSEKTVEVPVVGLNFPAGKVLRTFPSRVQVAFQVGLKNFKRVSENDFFIGVSYEDLLNNKSSKIPLTLRSKPDFVNHVRIVPEEVDYLIEQQPVEEGTE